eukprot:CAMPEP_0172518660 /NCGR_PEP_ID=MMETSP1066-20121228/290949_1 /TAXON_ID=671091 /ORGANISM="Coscinodiscus wailesii, Strain CCMP2513" /LENGTH=1115 /DNA_ID=CAMNT_0013301091 /DNA_START=657 /DNA_END=4001 /DNA_ORIENTATION=-
MMSKYRSVALAVLLLTSKCVAQQVGHYEAEQKPYITLKECTNAGGCTSKQALLTLDANWRWIHSTSGYDNCYTGNQWDTSICTDGSTCAQQCALEGVSEDGYANTYGVEQLADGVKLKFVTEHQYGVNVGSRLYIMDGEDKYRMFYLKNREFAIDIDVSDLYCGMNGAMYFVEMDEFGGRGLGSNNAGAKYGTGYCDAQCPHDIKFISGEANVEDWVPNPKDLSNNMGMGKYGTCCAEMDIWEANSMATAYTPHPCNLGIDGKAPQYKCEGIDCGDNDKGERYKGVCDKDGCDINPYRMGNRNFYGRGPEYAINTLKPMTVVTQFITDTGTDDGDLVEIKRFYVQDGQRIDSPYSTILGSKDTDLIDDGFCEAKKALFGDVNDYQAKGGTKAMGDSLDRGQVAALSLWDDVEVNMLWLDSAYPLDKAATDPGVQRGDCPGGSTSTPTYVRNTYPDGHVIFKNAAIGEIGSTTTSAPSPPTPPYPSPSPPTSFGSYCCSQNFKDCVTWCGTTQSECESCNQDVFWVQAQKTSCTARWESCTGDEDGCCNGLTCVGDQYYSQCKYVASPPTKMPVPTDSPVMTKIPSTPTRSPMMNPYPTKIPTVPTAPTKPSPSSLYSCSEGTGKSSWEALLALEPITYQVSANPYILSVVASGGAAGDGSYVVSESQAYGVLVAGLALVSVDESSTYYESVKRKFEGYFNGWRQMCRNSNPAPCQNPTYCDHGSSPCLPGWKHLADFSAVEGTGAAPDGDEDAIVGMIMALKAVESDSVQPLWYEEVQDWADRSCTQFLQDNTVLSSSGSHRVVKLGSCWGGWELDGNNPSYHAPGHYRMMRDFQQSIKSRSYNLPSFVNADSWNMLIDTSYKFLETTQCPDTGLVPNWAIVTEMDSQTLEKYPGSFSGSGTPQYEFGAEASRTMWRIAFDSAAYPEESAAQSWSFMAPLHDKLVSNFNPNPANGWEYFGEASLGSCSPIVSKVFDSWQWNYFISAPVLSTLVAGISQEQFADKTFNQQAMVDAACEHVSDTVNQSYYPLSWQVIAKMTLNGEVAKAGALFVQPPQPTTNAPVPSPTTSAPAPAPFPMPSSHNTHCCTWDFYHCGNDTWCNKSNENCHQACGGTW